MQYARRPTNARPWHLPRICCCCPTWCRQWSCWPSKPRPRPSAAKSRWAPRINHAWRVQTYLPSQEAWLWLMDLSENLSPLTQYTPGLCTCVTYVIVLQVDVCNGCIDLQCLGHGLEHSDQGGHQTSRNRTTTAMLAVQHVIFHTFPSASKIPYQAIP